MTYLALHKYWGLLLAATLIAQSAQGLPASTIYVVHQLLPPKKIVFSPLYGHCAWRSRLIFFLHAFAPESSALGKLVRTFFYKQPFDGTVIPTQNPRSVVRKISPELWGEVALLTRGGKVSAEDIGEVISSKTNWKNECEQKAALVTHFLDADPEYQKISNQLTAAEKEKDALIGETGPEALQLRKSLKLLIAKLSKALKIHLENLPPEKKSFIADNERDAKSPKKLASLIIQAAEECGSLWPKDLVYTIISAFVETTATSLDDLTRYLDGLDIKTESTQGETPQKLEILPIDTISKEEFRAFLEKNPAQLALSLIEATYGGIIENVPYRKDTPFNGDQFADCTEVAILNLINWLAYDEKTRTLSLKNIEKLSEHVSIHTDITAYYQKFPTPSLQKSFEAHTAWAHILAHIKGAHYIKKDHELKTDEVSILRALEHCIFSTKNPLKESVKETLGLFATLAHKKNPAFKLSRSYQKKGRTDYWTLSIESATDRAYFVAAPHHAAFIQMRMSKPAIAYVSEQLVSEKNSPAAEQLLVSLLFLERFSSIEPISGESDLKLLLLIHFLSIESADALKVALISLSKSKKLGQERPLTPHIEETLHRAFLYHPEIHTDEALKEHILRALPKELPSAIDRMIHRTINGKSIASEINRLQASSSSITVM